MARPVKTQHAVVVFDPRTGTPIVAYGPFDEDEARRIEARARDEFCHPVVMRLGPFGGKK